MQDLTKRINQIQTENKIWFLYLFLIFLSLKANSFEIDYFKTNNQSSKETYRQMNLIVFIVLIFVYAYFEEDAIKSFFEKDKSKEKEKYDALILVASTLVFISGFIFLYIILSDENLEEEIAFS